MIFQAIFPGITVILSPPFDHKDVGPMGMHPEFIEQKMPMSGFFVTFHREKLDGQEVWIYNTADDKRINKNPELKKHYEEKLLHELELGERNYKVYEPPKQIMVDREKIEKLEAELAKYKGGKDK